MIRRRTILQWEGVHRGGSGIFKKGAEPMDLGTKFPKWDPREKSQKGVWGTKLKQKCEIMYNF